MPSEANKEEKMKDLERQIRAALPVLVKVGMFNLFSVEEWEAGKSEGRKMVGRVARESGLV